MDRGACRATVRGGAKELDINQQLNNSNKSLRRVGRGKKQQMGHTQDVEANIRVTVDFSSENMQQRRHAIMYLN